MCIRDSIETAHVRKFTFKFLENGEVKIKNESEPKFEAVSYTHLDVYKRQVQQRNFGG